MVASAALPAAAAEAMSPAAQAQVLQQQQQAAAGAREAPESPSTNPVTDYPGSAAAQTRRRRREKLKSLDALQHSLPTIDLEQLSMGEGAAAKKRHGSRAERAPTGALSSR